MPYLNGPSGIVWHYEEVGKGQTIIFLHGWGVSSQIWTQQLGFFSRTHRVLALDLPGHGLSNRKKITFDSMVNDIDFFVKAKEEKSLHLVASSFGGLIAILIAFLPQVKSLTLVGALPKFLQSSDYPYGLAPERVAKLRAQLVKDYPSIVQIFFRSLFTSKERQGEWFRWLESFRAQQKVPQKRALERLLDMIEKEDRRKEFLQLQLPLLLVNGTEDAICPLPGAVYLKKQKPHARLELFEDCGHFPFLSHPEKFNKLLEDFLKEVKPSLSARR